ncbi:hypothetical protein GCM10022377_17860 [Zhihengliuella alba]|uniref:Uncharacterized protein n=1 Tax=Zhihengliuella alba TaxID=547018 RepID=A0ABP7DI00_9MICC
MRSTTQEIFLHRQGDDALNRINQASPDDARTGPPRPRATLWAAPAGDAQ